MDATILREAVRRLRNNGKGSPSQHGYCPLCEQNERYKHRSIIEVLEAVATHAESVPDENCAWYAGIYCRGGENG